MTLEFDYFAPEVRANPYPHFARLRDSVPVARGARPLLLIGKPWYLSRYDDVLQSLQDPRLVSDRRRVPGAKDPFDRWWAPNIVRAFQDNMISSDEPDHTRLKTLVHKAFTPRRVEALTDTVRRVVTRLLDDAARKGRTDLVADLALPLPLIVISTMLGVPDRDRRRFHRLAIKFRDVQTLSKISMLMRVPAIVATFRFLRQLVRLRREQPGDDLLTDLVKAEENTDRLTENELLCMVFLLLLAGSETTTNLIGKASLALMQHPEQLAVLRARPEIIDIAVEELLRFADPVEYPGPRFAREDFDLHGQHIRCGDVVLPLISSANRDERVFVKADTLDLTRQPNRHLAFGMGIHYCLGAPLARLEGRIAIQELVNRFPRLRLAVPAGQLQWRTSLAVRGLEHLPVDLS